MSFANRKKGSLLNLHETELMYVSVDNIFSIALSYLKFTVVK